MRLPEAGVGLRRARDRTVAGFGVCVPALGFLAFFVLFVGFVAGKNEVEAGIGEEAGGVPASGQVSRPARPRSMPDCCHHWMSEPLHTFRERLWKTLAKGVLPWSFL